MVISLWQLWIVLKWESETDSVGLGSECSGFYLLIALLLINFNLFSNYILIFASCQHVSYACVLWVCVRERSASKMGIQLKLLMALNRKHWCIQHAQIRSSKQAATDFHNADNLLMQCATTDTIATDRRTVDVRQRTTICCMTPVKRI